MLISFMKIYTKTGDTGSTSLIGRRVLKTNSIIELNGNIDELSAFISLTILNIKNKSNIDLLKDIQADFIQIMSYIAGKKDSSIDFDKKINKFEQIIDLLSSKKDKPNRFILVKNNNLSVYFNLLRTITRRVERRVILSFKKDKKLISYFNRLSDLFFTMSYV